MDKSLISLLDGLTQDERRWAKERARTLWLEKASRTAEESLLMAIQQIQTGNYEARVKPTKPGRGI